jgi:hypothetical protein
MLEGLPGDRIADGVEAPATQPGEVDVGRSVIEVKRAADEGLPAFPHIVPEARKDVGWLANGGLRRAREVDASEQDGAAGGVDKVAVDGVDEVMRGGFAGGGRHGWYSRHGEGASRGQAKIREGGRSKAGGAAHRTPAISIVPPCAIT